MDLVWKLLSAGALLAMIVLLWPQAKRMLEESREAPKDWAAVWLPLAAVVGVVILLIAFVRG